VSPIRQYKDPNRLYDFTLSLSREQADKLKACAEAAGKTKSDVLQEMVEGFNLEVKKDQNILRRWVEKEGSSGPWPVKNTFRLTGGHLNRLRTWAIRLKMKRSEVLRRIIEHYI
jgi:predicted DNA-binding protein